MARPSGPIWALSPGASCAGCVDVSAPGSSWPASVRRASMSPASMMPSTGRFCAVSNFLTAFSVPEPNSPSTPTLKPARLRKSCRTRMSWPLIPRLTGMRSPRLWCAPSSLGSSEKPPLALALEPRSARLRALTVRVPTVPLGSRRAARWKRLTARRCRAEVAVGLDLEAGLAQRLLELAHVGAGGACAQRAVAEMRRLGRPARQRVRRGDDGHAQRRARKRQKSENDGRTAARRLETPLFLGAYGVSCRARAKKAALRRSQGDDSPHATEVATGSPALRRGTAEIRLVKTTGAS